MKSVKTLVAITLISSALAACSGQEIGHNYTDTSRFGGVLMNQDTSTPTKVTGDAGIMDNSGAGGTKITKALSSAPATTTTAVKDTTAKKM